MIALAWITPGLLVLSILPGHSLGTQQIAPPAPGPAGPLSDSDTELQGGRVLPDDDLFGRLVARGSYEISSLATDSVLGREDWELYEDEAGFRTLRGTTSLQVDGASSTRTATVTVNPELLFVEADVGSTVSGVEAYATFRRTGDLLTVEAFGGTGGETRQRVRFPERTVFASQLFATRGWELAPFETADAGARPAYVTGTAPGILVGEIRTLSAHREGQEELTVGAGRFRVLRFSAPPADGSPPDPETGEQALDRWWVLAGSRMPAAAELTSLGVRVELVELEQDLRSGGAPPPGPVLARGVYHHRPLRRTEPLAIESWTLTRAPGGGYFLESEISYAEGPSVGVRATADSLFQVRDVQLRRRTGGAGETTSWTVVAGELRGEARGSAVGVAEQRFAVDGMVAFRLGVAALEGWAVATSGGAATGRVTAYWLPAGANPLGTLLTLPPEIGLGEERVATPARTFSTRRWASPAETPAWFRATRWVFGPWRLAARVLYPGMGREAILVRYETPE